MYTYKNNSRLPPFIYKTNTRIHCFCVTNKDILSIINSLNSSKAHGYDNISIKIMKICNESVTIPLKIIFEESLKNGIFPDIWKKENIIPAHKKLLNYYQWFMKYKLLLMKIPLFMWEEFYLTFRRHLTKFDMTVSSLHKNHMRWGWTPFIT